MYKYLDRIRLRIIHKSVRRSSFLSLFFQRRCLFLKHRQVMSSMWFSTKKASSNAAVLKCGCLQDIWTTPVLNGGRPQRLRQSCPHLALTFSPPDVCGRTFQHLPVWTRRKRDIFTISNKKLTVSRHAMKTKSLHSRANALFPWEGPRQLKGLPHVLIQKGNKCM